MEDEGNEGDEGVLHVYCGLPLAVVLDGGGGGEAGDGAGRVGEEWGGVLGDDVLLDGYVVEGCLGDGVAGGVKGGDLYREVIGGFVRESVDLECLAVCCVLGVFDVDNLCLFAVDAAEAETAAE